MANRHPRVRAVPTVGRKATRERQSRNRIAAPQLRLRYPKLTSLQLGFVFSDTSAFLPSPQMTVLHPPARAYFCFACPYGDCDGEFDLTDAIERMIGAREARARGAVCCAGTRHGSDSCKLRLEYTLVACRG